MTHDTREEMIAFIRERAKDVDDIIDLIIGLERLYDFRASLVTRGDVESEFEDSYLFDGQERRIMSNDEWKEFTRSWFWRKGHSEIMWDGVAEAIRWELRDLEMLPKHTVI